MLLFRVHERTPAQPQGTHTSTQPQAPSTHRPPLPWPCPWLRPQSAIRRPDCGPPGARPFHRPETALILRCGCTIVRTDYIEDPHRHTALLSPVGQRLSERDRDCVRVTGGAADGIRRTLSTTHDLLRGQLLSPRAKGGASSGIIAAASVERFGQLRCSAGAPAAWSASCSTLRASVPVWCAPQPEPARSRA